jgi:hypothetical protein
MSVISARHSIQYDSSLRDDGSAYTNYDRRAPDDPRWVHGHIKARVLTNLSRHTHSIASSLLVRKLVMAHHVQMASYALSVMINC